MLSQVGHLVNTIVFVMAGHLIITSIVSDPGEQNDTVSSTAAVPYPVLTLTLVLASHCQGATSGATPALA